MFKGSAGPLSVVALPAPVTQVASIEQLVEETALVCDSGDAGPSLAPEDEASQFTPAPKAKGVSRFIHVISL